MFVEVDLAAVLMQLFAFDYAIKPKVSRHGSMLVVLNVKVEFVLFGHWDLRLFWVLEQKMTHFIGVID